jgi:hypothetical protein
LHAGLHFPGGLVGERDGKNLPRINAMLKKVGDPVGNHARFAATGSG